MDGDEVRTKMDRLLAESRRVEKLVPGSAEWEAERERQRVLQEEAHREWEERKLAKGGAAGELVEGQEGSQVAGHRSQEEQERNRELSALGSQLSADQQQKQNKGSFGPTDGPQDDEVKGKGGAERAEADVLKRSKAEIVEIPFARVSGRDEAAVRRAAESARLGCAYVMAGGRRCGEEVAEGRHAGDPMCRRHRMWEATGMALVGVPYPEDAVSFHDFALMLMASVASGRYRRAELQAMTELARMVERNMRRYEWERRHGAVVVSPVE